MDNITSISENALNWSSGSGARTPQPSALQKTFSEIIAEREADPPFANTDESKGQEPVTVSKVMPDGSVLITVMRGEKVISQRRTRNPKSTNQAMAAVNTNGSSDTAQKGFGKLYKTKLTATSITESFLD
jgi:hypothetical protein